MYNHNNYDEQITIIRVMSGRVHGPFPEGVDVPGC